MRARIFKLAGVLAPILLPILVAVLWVRSYWVEDTISYDGTWPTDTLVSSRGCICTLHLSPTSGAAYLSGGFRHLASRPPELIGMPRTATQRFRCFGVIGFEGSLGLSRARGVCLAWWHLSIVSMSMTLPTLLYCFRVRRTALRIRNNLCARCGYDLRATPEFCPECGYHSNLQREERRL